MRKACGKPVVTVGNSPTFYGQSSTGALTHPQSMWVKQWVTPPTVHNFGMQLYSHDLFNITGVYPQFLHLSTPLIIRAKNKNKENNQLLRRG